MGGLVLDKFTDSLPKTIPSWVGFVAVVLIIVIVAKKLPVVGKHV